MRNLVAGLQALSLRTSRFRLSLRTGLLMAAGLLVVVCAVELLWPVHLPPDAAAAPSLAMATDGMSQAVMEKDWLAALQRRNLFEPAVPLPTRRVARQSVDRIMGMLSLNAIMKVSEGYVAYIQVKGFGLKRLREGEGVQELFRVLRIGPKAVELDVVGERMKLEL